MEEAQERRYPLDHRLYRGELPEALISFADRQYIADVYDLSDTRCVVNAKGIDCWSGFDRPRL